jgi:hypothetical protein
MTTTRPSVALLLSEGAGSILTDAQLDDAIIRTSRSTQRVLVGIGDSSSMCVTQDEVVVPVRLEVLSSLSASEIRTPVNQGTMKVGCDSNTDLLELGCGPDTRQVDVGTGPGQTTINLGSVGDTVTIRGTLTTVQTSALEVLDPLMHVNAAGGTLSASNAGLQLQEGGSAVAYVKTSQDRKAWLFRVPGASSDYGLRMDLATSNAVILQDNLVSLSNGRVGINTASPTCTLDVQGTVAVRGDLAVDGPVMSLPVGDTSQRPSNPVRGTVRYNTQTLSFEGYGAGDAWGSLGGVKDVNGDTYVSAEMAPGCNDDNIRMFTSNQERLRIDSSGRVGVGKVPAFALDVAGDVNVATGSLLTAGVIRLDNSGNLSNIDKVSCTGDVNVAAGNIRTAGVVRLDNAGNLSNIDKVSCTGDVDTSGGNIRTAGVVRLDNSGNLSNIDKVSCSGDVDTSGGNLRTAGVVRLDNSGNLSNIDKVSCTGDVNVAAGNIRTAGVVRLDNSGNLSNIDKVSCTGDVDTSGGNIRTAGVVRLDNSGNLSNIDKVSCTGDVNTSGGNIRTAGVVRLDNSGNLSNIDKVSCSGDVDTSGGNLRTAGVVRLDNSGNLSNIDKVSCSGDVDTSGGNLRTAGVVRLDNAGNLSNIHDLSCIGEASFAGSVLRVPTGSTAQRPSNPVQGLVRYNTQLQSFEGFGSAWGSLGGVKDVDGDTFVSAEMSPGCNDDNLRMFTSNQERLRIDAVGRVGIGKVPAFALDVAGDVNASSLRTGGVVRVDQSGNLSNIGNVSCSGSVLKIPVGDVSQRPLDPVPGIIRYNTDSSTFEGFGSAWGSLGGVKDVDGDTFVSAEMSPGCNDDNLRMFTSNQERLRIDAVGRVGIGKAIPAFALDVVGDANAGNLRTGGVVRIDQDGNLSNIGSAAFAGDVTVHGPALQLPKGTASERPSTASEGLIRYNTETSAFEGCGAGGEWGSLLTVSGGSGGGAGSDLMGVKDVNGDTYISAEMSTGCNDDNLRMMTRGRERVRITPAGNVGIGTKTPAANLDVVGGMAVSANVAVGGTLTTAGTTFAGGVCILKNQNPVEISTRDIGMSINRSNLVFTVPQESGSNAFVFMGDGTSELAVLTDDGRLGIGTVSPAAALDVVGDVNVSGTAIASGLCITRNPDPVQSSTHDVGFSISSSSNLVLTVQANGGSNAVLFVAGSNEIARMSDDGRLSLGANDPSNGLDLWAGNVRNPRGNIAFTTAGSSNPVLSVSSQGIYPAADNGASCGLPGKRWTSVYSVNGTLQTSDARLKTDVRDSDLGMSFVNNLRPVSFRWGRDFSGDARVHYGLVAQEVLDSAPDFSGVVIDDDGMLMMAYAELMAPMIKAIQELSERVQALESGAAHA